MNWIMLAIGSLAGGFSRYALAGAVQRMTDPSFPYGTLAVNMAGCFLIGLLNALSENKFLLDPQSRILLMTGFCGAFTTFSTFILESMNLVKDGEILWAAANVGGSVILGFFAFLAAETLVKLL